MASSSPRLIVIAASAGSLPAIIDVLAPLPPDLPAAIALVQHRGASDPHVLIDLLARRTRLRVVHAEDGAVFEAGTVYVCPPGVHMVAEHSIRLIEGPRVRFVQPNADMMFHSVGRTYGEGAIGVVLSGCGTDAAAGSLAIAAAGGTVLAQDDATSQFSEMPQAARTAGAVDQVLAPAQIARELQRLLGYEPSGLPRPETRARTRVVLVDDHRILLDGLAVLLEREPDLTVVAKADDGASAVRLVSELEPDVVVMDIRMPRLDGVQATERILSTHPMTRVIALSAESDPLLVKRMLEAGAAGYLSKERAFQDLVAAIHSVMQGQRYLSPEIARLVGSYRRCAETSP